LKESNCNLITNNKLSYWKLEQTNLCCRGADQTCGTSRKASLPANNSSTAPLPPPPPTPIPVAPNPSSPPTDSSFVLPPPPPLPFFVNVITSDASMEPPMPPPLRVPVARAPTPEPPTNHARLLPQQEIPTPRTKMKTINWNKIPNHKVFERRIINHLNRNK